MITATAAQAGLGVGPYLRQRAVHSTAAPGARSRAAMTPKDLPRLLAAMNELGAHVNRLAKSANTTGELPDHATLERTALAIEAMRDAMRKVLRPVIRDGRVRAPWRR